MTQIQVISTFIILNLLNYAKHFSVIILLTITIFTFVCFKGISNISVPIVIAIAVAIIIIAGKYLCSFVVAGMILKVNYNFYM